MFICLAFLSDKDVLPPAGFDFQTCSTVVCFYEQKSAHIYLSIYLCVYRLIILYQPVSLLQPQSDLIFYLHHMPLEQRSFLSLLQIYKVVHLWGRLVLVIICEGVDVSV